MPQTDFQQQRPTELKIGDSVVMIGDAQARGEYHSFLYVYVSDVGAVFGRATEKAVEVVEVPSLTPYGGRRAVFIDL